ncbi:MAG TPA: ABC transporter permease [Propioniciclava tarda]|nr:ABC transporter permease [Propioniciclava tarda]HQA29925.1 ABC transporter permease [Propioniciclava tarda]HQD60538.1 ABC transporter permease [Propioniciclava tarda]
MTEFIRNNRVAVIGAAVVLLACIVLTLVAGTDSDIVRKTTSILRFAWTFAIPLVLAALVGVIGERSGVVNIGIEGQILASAFAGFFVAAASGSVWIGILAGLLTGMVMGAFLAWLCVRLRMDQIIAGVVLNIVATGITSFYYVQGKSLPSGVPVWEVPLLSKIPIIGPVFFRGGPIALGTLVVVVGLVFALFHTRWGLRTRAIGEYPTAADTAGINVNLMRFVNVTMAGLLAGAAGAVLSMEQSSTFERGMSAGKGFLALAIMIFGAWFPGRAFFAALFFGLMSGLASQLQADKVVNIPQQFINLLPFVLTLIILSVAAGRVRPPAASGQPFVKGEGS